MASHGVPRGSGILPNNDQDRKKELQKIDEYKNLVDTVKSEIHKENYTNATLELTSKLLKQNPEYYTIWNYRRLIFHHLLNDAHALSVDDKDGISDQREAVLIKLDLAFLIPLLRKFPKCYWIWNYRLWLLEQAANECLTSSSVLMWQSDLALVSKMLSLDSRNFLAWGYRRTVVAGLEAICNMSGELPKTLTESEFEYTTTMVNANLSNFSAWHRRSKLIPRLLAERGADDASRRQMLDTELESIERALWADDNDQSLWFYHQHLMCTFDPRYAEDSMVPHLSARESVDYVIGEMTKLLNMLDGAEHCKWIYQALINMSLLLHRLGGKQPEEAADVEKWIGKLETLDPLRAGRWKDLRRNLNVE